MLYSRLHLCASDMESSCMYFIYDSALVSCCWKCEVAMAELFPLDVAKNVDEFSKIWNLGRPLYKLKVSASGQNRFKSHYIRGCCLGGILPAHSIQPIPSLLFLGQRQPQRWGFLRMPPL